MDNQVGLPLFALAYNLGNFFRRLALPKSVKEWSLTTLRDKPIKIGARTAHLRATGVSGGLGGQVYWSRRRPDALKRLPCWVIIENVVCRNTDYGVKWHISA